MQNSVCSGDEVLEKKTGKAFKAPKFRLPYQRKAESPSEADGLEMVGLVGLEPWVGWTCLLAWNMVPRGIFWDEVPLTMTVSPCLCHSQGSPRVCRVGGQGRSDPLVHLTVGPLAWVKTLAYHSHFLVIRTSSLFCLLINTAPRAA